jgi:glutamate racemase
LTGDTRPIGIFDSGIGGLTVAAAIRQALPQERLLYFGDNTHVPYGPRPVEEIRDFSRGITRAMLAADCKIIVIACNTASGAALKTLRAERPDVVFVGMEPAVKPAVEHTRSGVVGVIATTYTVQGEVFNAIVERFAKGVEVLRQACPGLVKQIEDGDFDTPETLAMLHGWIDPMLERGIDVLVLGCTHYPIIRHVIERVTGPGVRVIEPSAAIARRVEQVLGEKGSLAPVDAQGGLRCFTSGDPVLFSIMLDRIGLSADEVRPAHWSGMELGLE